MNWGPERPLLTKQAWMKYKVTAKIIMIAFEIIQKILTILENDVQEDDANLVHNTA